MNFYFTSLLQDLVNLLKPFFDATELLSGSKYTTLNFVYPTIYFLMEWIINQTMNYLIWFMNMKTQVIYMHIIFYKNIFFFLIILICVLIYFNKNIFIQIPNTNVNTVNTQNRSLPIGDQGNETNLNNKFARI